jgi:hypothetical protein
MRDVGALSECNVPIQLTVPSRAACFIRPFAMTYKFLCVTCIWLIYLVTPLLGSCIVLDIFGSRLVGT